MKRRNLLTAMFAAPFAGVASVAAPSFAGYGLDEIIDVGKLDYPTYRTYVVGFAPEGAKVLRVWEDGKLAWEASAS